MGQTKFDPFVSYSCVSCVSWLRLYETTNHTKHTKSHESGLHFEDAKTRNALKTRKGSTRINRSKVRIKPSILTWPISKSIFGTSACQACRPSSVGRAFDS